MLKTVIFLGLVNVVCMYINIVDRMQVLFIYLLFILSKNVTLESLEYCILAFFLIYYV